MFATHNSGTQTVLRQLEQALTCGLDRIHDQCGPMLEVRPTAPGGKAYILEVDIRVRRQPGLVPLRHRGQRLR
ncbi:Uncharacterised protein [Mycobacteroides abscessus]|nr:Uncharacterised protein [Mycobacteroides abscessus]